MAMLKKILIAIGILLLVFAVGCFTGRRSALKSLPEPQVDTVTIRDTIIDYKPQEAVIPKGWELVPASTIKLYNGIIEAYKDSLERKPTIVVEKDTTYIAVPIDETTFTDGKTYKCAVEGYATKMLWHESYQETQYITKTVPVPTLPKFAISPDFSALVSKSTIFIGAGAKIDIWAGKWRFSPGVDYGLFFNNGGEWSHGPAVTFSANYNFIIK